MDFSSDDVMAAAVKGPESLLDEGGGYSSGMLLMCSSKCVRGSALVTLPLPGRVSF